MDWSKSPLNEKARDALIAAAADGRVDEVDAFLVAGRVNVRAGDSAPLRAAAAAGQAEVVELLLDRVPGLALASALREAARAGRVDVIRLLVARGAADDEAVALEMAARHDHAEATDALLYTPQRDNKRAWADAYRALHAARVRGRAEPGRAALDIAARRLLDAQGSAWRVEEALHARRVARLLLARHAWSRNGARLKPFVYALAHAWARAHGDNYLLVVLDRYF